MVEGACGNERGRRMNYPPRRSCSTTLRRSLVGRNARVTSWGNEFMRHFRILMCGVMWACAAAQAAEGPAPDKLLAAHCGHLLDTQAGVLLGATTVVIEGTRIREVVAGSSA